jgi:DNA helicase-2/ATP-dependent DNA helicase PcrA
MLVNDQKNIFIVGDYDQTIYSFRGSYPKIFSDFLNKYPQAMVFPLEYNYRSTKKILKLANHVIKNNKLERFIDKQLVGNNDSGDDVSLYRGHYEAKFVINEITKLIETKKYQYKDIVILYRSNSCSRKIEEELIKQSIPYHVYGTRKFYDRKEVKDLIAYLNLFNDKVKDIYVKRIINVPKRKITQSIVDKIEEYAYTTKNSFFNAVQKFAFENPHVNAFVKLIDELTIVSQQNQSISAFVKILVEKINYQQYLNDTEEVEVAIEKFHNVEQLISGIEEFEKNFFNNQKINATIADFLNEISLYTDLIDDSQVDFVNLMTIHAVKGLEFPVVFIAFINRGIMPSAYASSQLEIEEERRMLYVAITRAKNKLYMTCDKHDFSSYINEFGNDNFVIVNDSFQEINQQD